MAQTVDNFAIGRSNDSESIVKFRSFERDTFDKVFEILAELFIARSSDEDNFISIARPGIQVGVIFGRNEREEITFVTKPVWSDVRDFLHIENDKQYCSLFTNIQWIEFNISSEFELQSFDHDI